MVHVRPEGRKSILMDIKQKITALAESHPELLGFRGKLTYMLLSVIPENADVSDMTVLDLMRWIPDEHLEYIYTTLKGEQAS